MEPIQFFFIIVPLTAIISILVAVVFYLSRKTEETDYEKEIKRLRQLLIKGDLDRETFLNVRENLKAEDLFSDESKRLDEMLESKTMDSDTYLRMKKVLQVGFNERLKKIDDKYNFDNSPLAPRHAKH